MKKVIRANDSRSRILYLVDKISPHVGVGDIVDFMSSWFGKDAVIECLEDLADRLVIDIEED